jgi:hypothetical protein
MNDLAAEQTPWNVALLRKVIFSPIVKQFPAFYERGKF